MASALLVAAVVASLDSHLVGACFRVGVSLRTSLPSLVSGSCEKKRSREEKERETGEKGEREKEGDGSRMQRLRTLGSPHV